MEGAYTASMALTGALRGSPYNTKIELSFYDGF